MRTNVLFPARYFGISCGFLFANDVSIPHASVGENISLDSLKQSCIYTLDRRTKSAIRISSFTKTMKYSKKLKSRYLQIRLEMWSIEERLFSVHFHTMGA